MKRILVVEDQETLREGILEALTAPDLSLEGSASGAEALAAVEREPVDLVLTDLRLEHAQTGLEILKNVRGRSPRTEVLLMTAYATVDVAVEAMKAGAFDFLTKPFTMAHLKEKVRQVLAVIELRNDLDLSRDRAAVLQDEVDSRFDEGRIVGESSPMRELIRQIDKVADSGSSILILGESGTGKEVVARAIHKRSGRRDGPFISVNCGALAEGVLESELFGHEEGAFTGAVRQKRGRFELADGGTLLLDEVAEVPPATQVRLLRVLQERSFERVGGERSLKVDVRVLAATHRNLEAEVKAGRFREDLFYRLYVIPLHIPPLRDRREDIPLLVDYFVGRLSRQMGRKPITIEPEALKLLQVYHWPGNVRELENVLERAIVLCEDDRVTQSDLPFRRPSGGVDVQLPVGFPPLREVVEEVERQMIRRALQSADGVKTEAARLLDLKPSVLYYKLEKYGISEDGG